MNRTREEVAYDYIKKAILSHQLLPGEKISEAAIAKILSCSRTPVRAAIKCLTADGLLVTKLNQCTRVASPSAKDVENAYALREALESTAVQLACEHVTDASIEVLLGYIEQEMEAYRKRDLQEYIRINDAFHGKIADMAHNPLLKQNIERTITLSNVFISLLDTFYEDEAPFENNTSFREHQIIVDALKTRDPVRASYAMKIHIISSRGELKTTSGGETGALKNDISGS